MIGAIELDHLDLLHLFMPFHLRKPYVFVLPLGFQVDQLVKSIRRMLLLKVLVEPLILYLASWDFLIGLFDGDLHDDLLGILQGDSIAGLEVGRHGLVLLAYLLSHGKEQVLPYQSVDE